MSHCLDLYWVVHYHRIAGLSCRMVIEHNSFIITIQVFVFINLVGLHCLERPRVILKSLLLSECHVFSRLKFYRRSCFPSECAEFTIVPTLVTHKRARSMFNVTSPSTLRCGPLLPQPKDIAFANTNYHIQIRSPK